VLELDGDTLAQHLGRRVQRFSAASSIGTLADAVVQASAR
jgi:hypothetical protein